MCDLSQRAECVLAFVCESERGPFVSEVEKRDERWSEVELLLIVGGHREPGMYVYKSVAESRVTNAHHIINSALAGSRSPAGPRRLRDSDAHKRIAVPRLSAFFGSTPQPRLKSGKVCRSDTRPRRVSETRGTLRG